MKLEIFLTLLSCLAGCAYCQLQPPVAYFYGIDKSLPEDTPVWTIVFFVNASDVDTPMDELRLRLDSNWFAMYSNGSVALKKPLDYESNQVASFELTVSDDDSNTEYTKTIDVTDVNDVKPEFSLARYDTVVPEDTPIGRILFNITVNDEDFRNDDQLIVRCIVENDFADACNNFKVNQTKSTNRQWKGYIYLADSLDYETGPNLYQIKLQADDGKNTRAQTFEVTIEDVADAPPRFDGSYSQVINENRAEDVFVSEFVIRVQAEDQDKVDPRPVRYGLTQNPGELFKIDSVTGNISTAKLIDREMANTTDGIIKLLVTARELLPDGSLGNDELTSASIDVSITIMDVNDNPPTFSQTHYYINVSEALGQGQALPGLVMAVTDADGGNNAYFKFVFSGLSEFGNIFEVSPPEAQGSATATLLVKNSTALDYDRGERQFVVPVVAREVRSSQPLSSTAIVTINLLDANDNKPIFNTTQNFTINDLSELTEPGVDIVQIPRAYDIDTEYFGTRGILYSLIGNGNSRFKLDRLTAILRLADCSIPGTGNCLDYEAVQDYNLYVVATDNNGTGHETRLPVHISIKDENDNQPVFSNDQYTFNIREETTTLTSQQDISATDRDSSRNGNNRVRFSIVSDRTGLFRINEVTGALSLNRSIQFTDSEEGRITLTIGAGNLLDSSNVVDFTKTATVIVFVDDINNNNPAFPGNYSTSILENILPGVEIIRVQAEDLDYGLNAALEYSIVSGDNTNTFQIDADTGIISRRHGAVIDYEVTPRYDLIVRATDKGIPRLSGQTFVTINVINSADRNPVFNPPTKYANVSEDKPIDSFVTSMQAIDSDEGAQLRYSFVSPIIAYDLDGRLVNVNVYNYTDLFRIDSTTGDVRINRGLDITKTQKILYSVKAVDTTAEGPEQSGTGTLTIDILNANNNAPRFDLNNRGTNIMEERPIGSLITIIRAVDDDRDVVFYEIINSTLPGSLRIDRVTGVVYVSGRIDYEEIQSISYTVKATDSGSPSRSTDESFTVTVTNINDNRPIFNQSHYDGELKENTSSTDTVAQVSATDLDLEPYGDISYELRVPPGVENFFRIFDNGMIQVRSHVRVDREQIKGIQISVLAIDGPGTPRRTSVVPVYIKITDINDNMPYFIEDTHRITLPETYPPQSIVIRVKAYDNDVTDSISYHIVNDPGNFYSIDQFGSVRLNKPLTGKDNHQFDIIALDNANNSAVAHVYVTVAKQPIWVFPRFDGDKVVVCEDSIPGVEVTQVNTRVRATASSRYSFIVNNQQTDVFEAFKLDPQTGAISLTRPVDREQRDKYLVELLATSSSGLKSQRYILLEICDKNDNKPIFPNKDGKTIDYNFIIDAKNEGTENCVKEPNTFNKGRIRATDLDLGEHAHIAYQISGGPDSSLFRIDALTGEICTKSFIDYNLRKNFQIQVTAHNYRVTTNGERILDVNDNVLGTVNVKIRAVYPGGTDEPLIHGNKNFYTSIDTQIGTCIGSMRPDNLNVMATYQTVSENVYNGTGRATVNYRPVFSTAENNDGSICTQRLFHPDTAGHNYRLNVSAGYNGYKEFGQANVWVTNETHRIKIVIDGNTQYTNSNRVRILNALKLMLGTNIIWIDSVGNHVNSETGLIDKSKSDVIIYAVNEENRHLMQRNRSISFINNRITGTYSSLAADVKILRAEQIYYRYIHLGGGGPSVGTVTDVREGGFPWGLLLAMLLLLPLLLLPFLLCCCLCWPCIGALGGKKEKYEMIEGAPAAAGYHQNTYIDDWYSQNMMYNNEAYEGDNWDGGSAHMLVSLGNGKGAGGMGGAGGAETVEETEEFYQTNMFGGGGMNGAAAGAAAGGAIGAAANGAAQRSVDEDDGAARVRTGGAQAGEFAAMNTNTMGSQAHSSQAATHVIVDSLVPDDAEREHEQLVMTETTEESRREIAAQQRAAVMSQPTVDTSQTDLEHSRPSLSPASTDMLDSASHFNTRMAARERGGEFSHTAIVNRPGTMKNTNYSSNTEEETESYESGYDQYPEQRNTINSRKREDSVTIILDAQPAWPGMEVEDAEYEVLADQSTGVHAPSRGGFTIELEPDSNPQSGMIADREEYVLTDDDNLSSDFYADAPRSPSSRRRRYRKTETRVIRDESPYRSADY